MESETSQDVLYGLKMCSDCFNMTLCIQELSGHSFSFLNVFSDLILDWKFHMRKINHHKLYFSILDRKLSLESLVNKINLFVFNFENSHFPRYLAIVKCSARSSMITMFTCLNKVVEMNY